MRKFKTDGSVDFCVFGNGDGGMGGWGFFMFERGEQDTQYRWAVAKFLTVVMKSIIYRKLRAM